MAAAQGVRLIKKYPNRRLYDTRTSTYITLSDVKSLVLAHEEFRVVDAKTDEDLTRSILLQIILEEETAGAPMFTSDLLAQMIRFYGNAMQGFMGNYLATNLKTISEMQAKLQDQARTLYGENNPANQELWMQFMNFQGPALSNLMNNYAEQSQKVFAQLQEQVQAQTRNLWSGFPFPGFAPASPNDKSEEKK